jgi:hypothetical protein
LTWQANQVFNNPATLLEEKSIMLSNRQSSSGLSMLQGWKATQVRPPAHQDWQTSAKNSSEEAHKKLKGKSRL